jgi:hypothetical protein
MVFDRGRWVTAVVIISANTQRAVVVARAIDADANRARLECVIRRAMAVPPAANHLVRAAIAISANAADAIMVADARNADVSQEAAGVIIVQGHAVTIVTIPILAIAGRGTAIGTRAMVLAEPKAGAVCLKPLAMIRAERDIVCRNVTCCSAFSWRANDSRLIDWTLHGTFAVSLILVHFCTSLAAAA